ncbi:hypothetical protein RRG08_061958 [Elysia crispata]|uniref:Uncharacterized protein n=1 Tax=Elysia crispata TaxID=231223 RepID=A0AAE0ZJC6_9GAST|nr:hypothetical protein RRG08_061958 [Elysia crispata]
MSTGRICGFDPPADKPTALFPVTSQGRSLLMLDETYDLKSLTTLAIGVEKLEVNLTDHPIRCLRKFEDREEETLRIVRSSFLRDFADPNQNTRGSLSPDEHICSKHVEDDGGYAHFVYRCCRFDQDGEIVCLDVIEDNWIKVLLTLIIIIKVLVVLYSPMFLPETLYRIKYVAAQYLYHLPGPAMTLKVVVSEDPDQYGPQAKHKCVRLEELKNMEVFKTMVASSNWQTEKIYEVKVKDVRLSVKARRLLSKFTVPVSIKSILYNNLIRCRIRKLEPLKDCCNSNILGRFNPGIKMIKWHHCMKWFAGLCLMVLISTPWILRIYGYFTFEDITRDRQVEAAERLGLEIKYPGSIVLYLSPVHGLFIFIYIIFIIDSLVYGVLSKAMKEKFKHVARDCLRDMRERSRIAVVAWMTKLLVLPFTVFGVLGFLLFVPYLILLAVVTLPVAAFYIFPTLNLSIRLLINLFIFLCPDKLMNKCRSWHGKFSSVRERFSMHDVTANESFIQKHSYTRGGVLLQLVVILMVLISFWSVTLMLMEIVTFFVELLVYTFMGVIVNAGTILQYVTVLFLLFMYSKNTFSRVANLYQAYHGVIHRELLGLIKEEIDEVAKQEATDQENTAFIVQGESSSNTPKDVRPRIKIKENQPQWSTQGMLVFLDKYDTPYTPEKFFFETIDLNYFGCPGPIYTNVLAALWEFLKIVLFLLFIFIVVMAFGDAYQVSTTNQLLATVVGGFVPFLFRYIFVSDAGVGDIDTKSIQFITEFHRIINSYKQAWGVFDIVPVSYKEWDYKDDDVDAFDDTSPVDGNGNRSNFGPSNNVTGGGINGDPSDSISPLLDSTRNGQDGEFSRLEVGGDPGGLLSIRSSGMGGSTVISIDDSYPDVDIIVDVSTSKTRRFNALQSKGFEKGSTSMLDRTGHNPPIFKPSNPNIYERSQSLSQCNLTSGQVELPFARLVMSSYITRFPSVENPRVKDQNAASTRRVSLVLCSEAVIGDSCSSCAGKSPGQGLSLSRSH